MRYTYTEGKVEVWSGSIQPHDVWLIKGGAVLVKFVADIAKKAELCPIGVVNWRNVNKQVQADIVELIRVRYFNLTVQTRQQIENDNPGGIVRGTWLELVKYWYLCQSKKYADNGREARAMLSHLHTNGSTSFANSRDEFEMEHGREPGGYEFFDRTHKTKDGRSDVMGVHALLWKKGIASEMNNENNDLKVKFARHKKETANLIKRWSSFVSDLLTAVQSGRVSPEKLAATNSALRTITTQ
ncbi:hypothetical protein RDABS01_017303, partial [Bienertia sinuspersici]